MLRQVSGLDDIGVYSGFKDMLRYDYSSFDFRLETELDLYSRVAKYGKIEILDMPLAKTQFGQTKASAHSDKYSLI